MMTFASRQDAGHKLGQYLQERQVDADVVLGLPRGGAIVAIEVARLLRLPLDVLIVRKLGHPMQREFAVGALAEGEVLVLDDGVAAMNPGLRAELDSIIEEEKIRLAAYRSRFHRQASPALANRAVLLVDDGLATGATAQAAVLAAKKQLARRVVVAAPVASRHAVRRLEDVADEVAVLLVDPAFEAVGQYYEVFPQTTDEEVLAVLQG
jgi:predicted phosphoribosyltransferase